MARFFGRRTKRESTAPPRAQEPEAVPRYDQAPEPTQERAPRVAVDVSSLDAEIALQSDRLYGIALFFEGLETLFDGREEIILASRDQLLGIIQRGTEKLEQAKRLLVQVKEGTAAAPATFDFGLGAGFADQEALIKRADALVYVYNQLFPDRDRSKPFNEEEKLKLVEAIGGGD